jgi:1,4-alpha-glucan branching enzyme
MSVATLQHDVQKILRAEHHDPFRVLGMHSAVIGGNPRVIVRAFLPGADSVDVVDAETGESIPMERIDDAGFFETLYPPGKPPFPYRLRASWGGEETVELEDPYRFPSALGEMDVYLLAEGRDLQLHRKLGAHPVRHVGVQGTHFAVWAPNARRVSVVGDFNFWDGRRHPMRFHPGAGIWDIFLPDVHPGAMYKFEIKSGEEAPFLKSDPVGFQFELRPGTAGVVNDRTRYEWGDGEWMASREQKDPIAGPMSIYEVHLGSWRSGEHGGLPNYRDIAHQLADYALDLGYTHVELLPVMEHPYDPSWGYQVTGYFAPTSRFGTPDDFRYFVDHMHRRGIGVILDWVPAHFPRDAHGLRRFDGSALYEHEDPRQGEQPDWGTMVFNFGRNEVRNFLISNALYWLDDYHLDGLRVDAVASMLYLDYSREEGQWIPNPFGGRENLDAIDFLRELNSRVRERCPGTLMIAEESTAWPGVTHSVERGGLGFHLKWNMGWMNDFLRFVEEDPVHRKYHFGLLTFSLMYAFTEHFVLPVSHDEVVHGKRSLLDKMPGDVWQKFANTRLALGFMWGHPGKQLLFMGSEIGQWREWSEARPLDWELMEYPLHTGLQRWMADLNALYRAEPAFWERDFTYEGFQWIDFHDVENSVLSFLRRGANEEDELVFVFNFTPVPRSDYRVGVPRPGFYKELLNSDSEVYGGSNLGNAGGQHAHAGEVQQRPYSLCLTLPPLGMLVLKRDGAGGA